MLPAGSLSASPGVTEAGGGSFGLLGTQLVLVGTGAGGPRAGVRLLPSQSFLLQTQL